MATRASATSSPSMADGPEGLVDSAAAGPAALRGSVLLGGGYAITIGLSLISVPLLIRHLGIAGFGRYTTILALVTILSGLTDAGLSNIGLREWASRRGEERSRLMAGLLGIRLQLSAAGVVAGVIFAVAAGYNQMMVWGTFIAGIGMSLTAITNMLAVSLQGDLRFGWVTMMNIVRQVVAVALIVGLVIADAGLLPLLAATAVAGVAMLIVAALVVQEKMPLRPRMRDANWWPLVRDALPFSAAIALNALYFRITIVVMSLVAVARQTGYFATSFRVTEVLIGVPALAIGAAFPILSRSAHDDQDRFAYASARIIELAVIAGIGLALAVILAAPVIIEVLTGAGGEPAAPVLQIQSLALGATFLSMAASYVLLSLRRHGTLLATNGGALLMNVILTLVLVPADRAQGAAVAAALAETCLALVLLILVNRLAETQMRLLPLATVVIAGLAGATPLLVAGMYPLLRMVVGVAIYVAGLVVFHRFPPELRHILQHRHPGPDPQRT